MSVKHIIKTLHVSVTIVWPSSGGRLSCLVLLLLLCLFASSSCLFGTWLYVVYVCVRAWCTCLWDVWLWTVQFTTKHPTDKYIRHAHTHRQHTSTYQINNLTTQTSREVVTALSKKDDPLKMVKQLCPKHVGF